MRNILFFVLLLSCKMSFSQNSGNVWYFGNLAGITFNTVPPSILTNGQLSTNEGCASIADPITGNILLYTDGITVWDKNHSPMPGSIATPLNGASSSTQSAVIVPKPGNANLYYIFTTPDQVGATFANSVEMCYSIVDLTLNGGNGDLTVINTPIMDSTTEKIAVIGDCSGTAYWIVGHKFNCDSFYAFKLTSTGLSAPVKSKVGIVHQDIGSFQNAESIGYMKFSSDAKHLGLCTYINLNTVEIFNFDNNTGIISNAITDPLGFNVNFSSDGPYGCSFSPDGTKFYAVWSSFSGDSCKIYQYDLQAGSNAAVLASRKTIYTTTDIIGAIQNGPNGKMYIDNTSKNCLDVLNTPNGLGASGVGLSLNAIQFSTSALSYGLPGIVESFLSPSAPIFTLPTTTLKCINDTINCPQARKSNFILFPTGSYSVSSDSLMIKFFPTVNTTYTVISFGACGSNDTSSFTISIAPPPVAEFTFNPASPSLADVNILLQNQSIGAATYQWWKANTIISTNVDYNFTNTLGLGTYCFTLIAKNQTGCKDTIEHCVLVSDTVKTEIVLPNAFSPNGDGLNNTFNIIGRNVNLISFQIFNRFGELVFETNDILKGWDGLHKKLPAELGMYYYAVKYKDTKDKEKILKGDVLLIR